MLSKTNWHRALLVGAACAALSLVVVWITSRPNKSQAVQPLTVSCKAMEYAALLDIEPRKLRAGPEVGGMGRFHYTIDLPALPDKSPERVLIHPNVAIPAFRGWLLGGDRGEFGGELIYQVGEEGTKLFKLLDDNIEDIYKMPFGYVATAGLAHMSTDTGRMYLITPGNNEMPHVRQLFPLPAAPITSWRLESGGLLVNTNEGSVVLTQAERLEHVSCAEGTEDGV